MEEIYLVEGRTGEYADARSWIVAAFPDEEDARVWTDLCQARANELETIMDEQGISYWLADDREQNEFDPGMDMDYTGTEYSYFKVPVIHSRAAQRKSGYEH